MRLLARMSSRDPAEHHRPSTPLELLFDLTFVIAVSRAAAGLQAGLAGGHTKDALLGFPLMFFAIWWAWMNFSWFASAFDVDDVAYRIAVFVQMAGVLVLAAGIPRVFDGFHFGVIVVGYVVIRLAMVAQWVRAGLSQPDQRRCAFRYALGISLCQLAWVAWLALPLEVGLPIFGLIALFELAVPLWAEGAGRTSWNPRHIAERYGLFTIIVLGESLLSAANGVEAALDTSVNAGKLAAVVIGGVLTVFSMWWLYFDLPADDIVGQARTDFTERLTGAFAWGYGHYIVFASAAAAGASLTLAVDEIIHRSRLTNLETGFALTGPVVAYLLVVWVLHAPYKRPNRVRDLAMATALGLILASSATSETVLVTGVLMALLVGISVATTEAAPSATTASPS
jgi:low temperature requirement protein LtrA